MIATLWAYLAVFGPIASALGWRAIRGRIRASRRARLEDARWDRAFATDGLAAEDRQWLADQMRLSRGVVYMTTRELAIDRITADFIALEATRAELTAAAIRSAPTPHADDVIDTGIAEYMAAELPPAWTAHMRHTPPIPT